MADLLVEQIVAAVVALLTGSAPSYATSAGQSVFRGRITAIELEEMNDQAGNADAYYALGVFQGADAPLGANGRDNVSIMDSLVEIRIEAAARASDTGQVESLLNQLRKEIHAIMMTEATRTGLPNCIDVIPGGAEEPAIADDQELMSGTMVVPFGIKYRHSTTDASV